MLILIFISFINIVGFGMIFPLLPAIQSNLNITDLQTGTLVSAFGLFAIIGSIFFGYISDKIGRKISISIPLLFSSIVYILTVYVDNFYQMMILRALTGFFSGNIAVIFAMTSDFSSPEKKFKNMGIVAASFGFGFIVGPAFGAFLAGSDGNVGMPFLIAGFASLFSFFVSIIFLKETLFKEERSSFKDSNAVASVVALINNKDLIIFSYLMVAVSFIISSVEVYLSLWISQEFSFSIQQIGVFWTVFAVSATVVQMIAPLYIDSRKSLLLGFGGLAIGMLFPFVMLNPFLAYLLIVFVALSLGIIFPSINVSVAGTADKNEQGLAFGINHSVANVGRVLGPYLVGTFYNISPSYSWIFLSLFAFSTVIIIFKFVTVTHKHSRVKTT